MAAPAGLTIRNSLAAMSIGDCIPCRYSANSNRRGCFSELGSCDLAEIPIPANAAPDGRFYFIKVSKGLLVADRVVQSYIKWSDLNTYGYIHGHRPYTNAVPAMTGPTSPRGKASASSVYDSNYYAYLCFDNADANPWSSKNTAYPHWVAYEFPITIAIDGYAVTNKGVASSINPPTSWILQGSVDAINWENLDSRTVTWSGIETKKFTINNSKKFITYRLYCTAGIISTKCSISKLEFLCILKPYGSILVRSIFGGCAYADSNNKFSNADMNSGLWPVGNEWDTYIRKSTLNGKITPGDDNVWHTTSIGTLCIERPTSGLSLVTSTAITRGGSVGLLGCTQEPIINASLAYGFRPVLEYMEDGSSIFGV